MNYVVTIVMLVLQCFSLCPLSSVISCHQNIVVTYVKSFWFDGAYEINAPFCERF